MFSPFFLLCTTPSVCIRCHLFAIPVFTPYWSTIMYVNHNRQAMVDETCPPKTLWLLCMHLVTPPNIIPTTNNRVCWVKNKNKSIKNFILLLFTVDVHHTILSRVMCSPCCCCRAITTTTSCCSTCNQLQFILQPCCCYRAYSIVTKRIQVHCVVCLQ